jgi:hypothetical protein
MRPIPSAPCAPAAVRERCVCGGGEGGYRGSRPKSVGTILKIPQSARPPHHTAVTNGRVPGSCSSGGNICEVLSLPRPRPMQAKVRPTVRRDHARRYGPDPSSPAGGRPLHRRPQAPPCLRASDVQGSASVMRLHRAPRPPPNQATCTIYSTRSVHFAGRMCTMCHGLAIGEEGRAGVSHVPYTIPKGPRPL